MKIVIQAVLIPQEGYGYLGIETARSLSKGGHEVVVLPASGYGVHKDLDQEVRSLVHNPPKIGIFPFNSDVNMAIVPPVPCARVERRAIYPTRGGMTTLETMWEAQSPPSRWVKALKNMGLDYIVVPHKSSQECFERAGISVPYKVLTPGVEKNKFQFVARDTKGMFKFLTLGRMEPRKNPGVTLRAFQDAFPARDYPNVGLVMKTRPDTLPTEVVQAKRSDRRIHLISNDLTEEKLVELYYACHAFVFPSRGEGFSFPPRHAVCSGMPTIVTNNTAMADIPGTIRIDPDSYSPMSKCGFSDGEERDMLMADIDYHKVAEAMKDIYDNYQDHVEAARTGAVDMMSWDEFPNHFEEVFND